MKRFMIDIITSISSLLFAKRIYISRNEKANLGCGLRCEEGWENIDGSLNALFGSKSNKFQNQVLYKLSGSNNFYSFDEYNHILTSVVINYFDLRRGVPFAESSLRYIYCSHFLEHLTKNDAVDFLGNCFRALKKGGVLRLAVPDLDVAIKMYQDGEVDKMQDLFFYTSDNYDFSFHKYNYNFDTLRARLESIGFVDVERRVYQEGVCPDVHTLDVYPDHSLYLEAVKA